MKDRSIVSFPGRRALLGAVVAAALLAAAPAWSKPAGSWTVRFAGRAESPGTIVLKATPVGGEPKLVETRVPAGTPENEIARLVAASAAVTLGESYKVYRDDGEKVKIRKRSRKLPDYEVALEGSSLTGVTIRIERG